MADLNRYREVLAGSIVFNRLPPADLDRVLAVSALVEAKAGQPILSEGKPTDGLYVILEGEVDIFLPEVGAGGVRRASRVRLNKIGPGRCLGEYGVIDDQPSSASAVALTQARLCFLPKIQLRQLLERNDRVGRIVYENLLRFLVGRLRSKDKELDVFMLDPGVS